MKTNKRDSSSPELIPEEYLARMRALLGSEFPAYLSSLSQPPVNGLRVNELKIDPSSFREISPYQLKPVPWCPSGFILGLLAGPPGEDPPGKHPCHAAGLYYLQDPSAMAVAEILDSRPGESVLDLAAAPGGKSTHIVSLMKNQGLLIANEIHPQRVWELSRNLERWGARNCIITQETPSKLADQLPRSFDRVLLDAPCSGEGMFRKSPTARLEWSPELVKSCALRQSSILQDAARLVKPGGVLVYSTCTFAPEENEGVIAKFLALHPEFELEEIQQLAGYSRGRQDWGSLEGAGPVELSKTVRLWPHQVDGEGHYIARMRCTTSPRPGPLKRQRRHQIQPAHLLSYMEFCQAAGIQGANAEELLQVKGRLYRVPQSTLDLSELRVIHPGLWLGIWKHGEHNRDTRFEPAHALAMALSLDEIEQVTHLNKEGARAYLHGEVLNIPGPDGWILLTLDGFSLGWGKRVGGAVKNYYPKGLRWL